jgi:hypothetical protein
MGRTSYQNLKEYHPGYRLAGDRALEIFGKEFLGKAGCHRWAVWSRFGGLTLDQFNFSTARI